MQAQEEIIDYAEHKEKIDKWISLKGETKYLKFVAFLKLSNEPITWKNLSNTYRYDKRLLINVFKYMSFFEEFLRAQIWNVSKITYKKLEATFLNNAIDKVIELKNRICFHGFSIDTLIENRDYINYLRNRISHNKIMLESEKEGKNLKELLLSFKITLPESYREKFSFDINSCNKGLDIPQQIVINI